MKRKVRPSKLVLTMMEMMCPECRHVQWAWFTTTEEKDAWDCPVCAGRIVHDDELCKPLEITEEPDEDNVQSEGEERGTDRNEEDQEEVPDTPEDSTDNEGESSDSVAGNG